MGPWIWCKCQNLYLLRVRSGSQLLSRQIVQTIKFWCHLLSLEITLTDSELACWSALTTYDNNAFITSTALSILFLVVKAQLCWATPCKRTGDIHNVKAGIELLPWRFTKVVNIWFILLNIWFILITLHDIIIFFNKLKTKGMSRNNIVTFCFEFFCYQEGFLSYFAPCSDVTQVLNSGI